MFVTFTDIFKYAIVIVLGWDEVLRKQKQKWSVVYLWTSVTLVKFVNFFDAKRIYKCSSCSNLEINMTALVSEMTRDLLYHDPYHICGGVLHSGLIRKCVWINGVYKREGAGEPSPHFVGHSGEIVRSCGGKILEKSREISCNKCALCILEMGFLWNECSDVLENRF